jgi:malto-oligosyltrehalose trehalohydrolase
MPFGAQYRPGGTRFRLWAPACERVRLEVGVRVGATALEMIPAEGGWHEIEVPGVKPGSAYAFHVAAGQPPVPDPASRSNPRDVHTASVVVDPEAYEWRVDGWRGRPWHEAVVYELHVGTFTPEGTFAAAIAKLDHLRDVGVTAIELLPVADFAGRRGWGYDGVLPFAPACAYGTPGELKRLVDAAHERGLMILLDVVYNHFGPEGNYLRSYAPQFFNERHQTPWGAAINFDGDGARTVRDFFIHNALYWIEEYRFDGLRLDAVHAIADDSPKHIVAEIAEAVARGPGSERHVHLVLENDANAASLLGPGGATAQWNDDAHHALHVLATGERAGYYRDYADAPLRHLARTFTEGFAYQGEMSRHQKKPRGEPSAHLPLTSFIPFLQNHDQVGNRAMGDRLAAIVPPERLALARALLLLVPAVPLLFMGEEYGETAPFLYFCDFHGELADAVREGRRREFAGFPEFADEAARAAIPDPNAEGTFLDSKLEWSRAQSEAGRRTLEAHRKLLALRAREIAPRTAKGARGSFELTGEHGLRVDWTLGDGSALHLRANFGDAPLEADAPPGRVIHAEGRFESGRLGPWSAVWALEAR